MSTGRWAAVEIMGHRQHVGRISEESFAGATMLRVDVLQRDGSFETVRYGGSSIFSLRDVTEAAARAEVMRKDWQPCATFREPSALPGRCAGCGFAAADHDAAKALPPHDDQLAPPWDGKTDEREPDTIDEDPEDNAPALVAAIRAFTVDREDGGPNGPTEAAIDALHDALDPGESAKWPADARDILERACDAAGALGESLARDVGALREAAERYFGGDFRKER